MSDIKLRSYQENGIRMLNNSIREGNKKICWVFPTGAGKSTIASYYVKLCVKRGKRVLFFVHSKELVGQFSQRLRNQFNLSSGIIMAGVKQARDLPVQVASVQTLVRREYPPADIVFIDEAHRSKANTYKKIIEHYKDSIIVGLTATPFRGDGKGLKDIFEAIVHPVKIRDLIGYKFLVGTKVFASKDKVNMHGVKIVRGDYDTKEMKEKFSDGAVTRGVIDNYKQHAYGKKAIVFNVNVEHSIEMNDMFNKAGIPSAHLDGTTDKKTRARIVKDFANGKYLVLHNVGLFTEGFDVPDTEVVILNRATQSLGLYVQMVGRGLRPVWNSDYSDHKRDSEGNLLKPKCIVLDHGDNTFRHGFVEDYDSIPFSLDGQKKKRGKKKDGEAKTKECPRCHGMNHIAVRVCKHCDIEFPIKERKVTFTDGKEFVLLDRNAHIVDRLMNLPHNRIVGKIPISQLRICSLVKGYKRGWWFFTAIDHQYVKVDKNHPAAFEQVRTILELEEIKAGTHELYLDLKKKLGNSKKSKTKSTKQLKAA